MANSASNNRFLPFGAYERQDLARKKKEDEEKKKKEEERKARQQAAEDEIAKKITAVIYGHTIKGGKAEEYLRSLPPSEAPVFIPYAAYEPGAPIARGYYNPLADVPTVPTVMQPKQKIVDTEDEREGRDGRTLVPRGGDTKWLPAYVNSSTGV